ncbi:MAG: hypothetical protein NT032_07765, partial [Actinobacteria bacterium]|nr:hypothetical protein [Actinomycetota bacterium]
FDIAAHIPHQTVSLIAITTSLAVRKDTDSDVQLAILMAVKDAERGSNNLFFAKRNEFPTYMDPLIEISPVAKRFYDFGPPALLNDFAFWTATLSDRFSVLLLAVFAVLFPMKELAGHLKKIRSVIHEHDHYAELIEINRQVTTSNLSIEGLESILKRLKQIDQTKAIEKVKAGKEKRSFSLSEPIGMLQDKIEKQLLYKLQSMKDE